MTRRTDPSESVSTPAGGQVPLAHVPQHAGTLFTLLDETGTIQYESPAIERLFGFEQSALVGESVADFFHPEDRPRVTAAFEALVADGGSMQEAVEYRHEQADGSYRWVESVGRSEVTPDGLYVINTRDIEAQRERERELRRINERLDAFTSAVSHDLRNPLSVARGRLDLVAEAHESVHLEEAQAALDRMKTLVETLLAIAHDGDIVGETEPVELAEAAADAFANVPTASAELELQTTQTIHAHRSSLVQLLENLIGNAAEHGGGGVTVTIRDHPDGFSVADNGVGLPSDPDDRVLDAGYSTTDNGTGIGLAIVAEIADAHGWSVKLGTSDAGGARFTFGGVDRAA